MASYILTIHFIVAVDPKKLPHINICRGHFHKVVFLENGITFQLLPKYTAFKLLHHEVAWHTCNGNEKD
jgi:hypothetical protein